MLRQTLSVGLALLLPSVVNGYQNSSQFLNPILPGFHPDPSCTFISEEETFYCASSSFNAFPGIPIHASKDLTTWRLVGEFVPLSITFVPRRLFTCNYRYGACHAQSTFRNFDLPHVLVVSATNETPVSRSSYFSPHIRSDHQFPSLSSRSGLSIVRGMFNCLWSFASVQSFRPCSPRERKLSCV